MRIVVLGALTSALFIASCQPNEKESVDKQTTKKNSKPENAQDTKTNEMMVEVEALTPETNRLKADFVARKSKVEALRKAYEQSTKLSEKSEQLLEAASVLSGVESSLSKLEKKHSALVTKLADAKSSEALTKAKKTLNDIQSDIKTLKAEFMSIEQVQKEIAGLADKDVDTFLKSAPTIAGIVQAREALNTALGARSSANEKVAALDQQVKALEVIKGEIEGASDAGKVKEAALKADLSEEKIAGAFAAKKDPQALFQSLNTLILDIKSKILNNQRTQEETALKAQPKIMAALKARADAEALANELAQLISPDNLNNRLKVAYQAVSSAGPWIFSWDDQDRANLIRASKDYIALLESGPAKAELEQALSLFASATDIDAGAKLFKAKIKTLNDSIVAMANRLDTARRTAAALSGDLAPLTALDAKMIDAANDLEARLEAAVGTSVPDTEDKIRAAANQVISALEADYPNAKTEIDLIFQTGLDSQKAILAASIQEKIEKLNAEIAEAKVQAQAANVAIPLAQEVLKRAENAAGAEAKKMQNILAQAATLRFDAFAKKIVSLFAAEDLAAQVQELASVAESFKKSVDDAHKLRGALVVKDEPLKGLIEGVVAAKDKVAALSGESKDKVTKELASIVDSIKRLLQVSEHSSDAFRAISAMSGK